MRKYVSVILVLALVMTFCWGISSEAAVGAKGKINRKSVSVEVGRTVKLKVTGVGAKVKWMSGNKKIARVNKKGVVKGIKKGKTQITATAGKKKFTCRVTVKAKAASPAEETCEGTYAPAKVETPETAALLTTAPAPTPEGMSALPMMPQATEIRIPAETPTPAFVATSAATATPSAVTTTAAMVTPPAATSSVATPSVVVTPTAAPVVVKWMADRWARYDSDDRKIDLCFALIDSNADAVAVEGHVSYNILNGEKEVYSAENDFTKADFETWKDDVTGYQCLLCRITIPYDDIAAGQNSSGTIYFTVTGENYSFPEAEVSIRKLPMYTVVNWGDGFNYLAIGNSITKHTTSSYWWQVAGMAASTAARDYFHLVSSWLESKEQNEEKVVAYAYNAFAWETQTNDRSEVLELWNGMLDEKVDLVTIQLSENVSDTGTIEEDFREMVAYVQEKCPNAQVIVIDDFWSDAKSAWKKSAIADMDVNWVDLGEIRGNKAYQAGMGTVVYDADGGEHTIAHNGVAVHPGDAGMRYYAEKIQELIRFSGNTSEIASPGTEK